MKATASSSASSSVIPRWLLESNLTADLHEEDVAALINDVNSGGNAVSLKLYWGAFYKSQVAACMAFYCCTVDHFS